MTYVADDADPGWMIGLEASARTSGAGPRSLALLEAQRYRQTVTWCVASPLRSGTCYLRVRIRRDRVGRAREGPFTGSTFVFTVRDGRRSSRPSRPGSPAVQFPGEAPFAEWEAARHPKDFPVMYGTDSIPLDPEGST